MLYDLGGKRELEVVAGRSEESAKVAFGSLKHPCKVQTACLDMSEAFRNAVLVHLSQADLIHDRFHFAMMLSKAVDMTRRAEAKRRPELKDSRYVWLKNPENLSAKQKERFDALVNVELKTAAAYALK